MSTHQNITHEQEVSEPTLLIVDDAQMMRLKIERLAISAGWKQIVQAADGKQAIDYYRENPFHLVTMDIVMPEVDGLEALTRIRLLDAEAKVVMVSAINQKSKLQACIDAGAMDFVVKPFDAGRFERFLKDRYDAAASELANKA